MKFSEISESTTSGSIATVASPMNGVQKRGGNLLSGKKTNKKYANSVDARKQVKQVKESTAVSEDEISEQDLIVVPSQAHRLKSGFVSHDTDRQNHRVEMALGDLYNSAKDAKTIYDILKHVSEDAGIEGWVQEKIIKAADYLNTVREHLEHEDYSKRKEMHIAEKNKNPYAIGMAQAMKSAGDKPPLEKSTIKKAHKIAKSIKD